MMALHKLYMMLLAFCITLAGYSQNSQPETHLFVGSTPADSLIKSLLQIPAADKAEFIKWELNLPAGAVAGKFSFVAWYGESQPNTNGFTSSSRKKITATGNYTTSHGTTYLPKATIFYLDAGNLSNKIVLVQLDGNVLHFADSDKHLLAGNGGWGYVLNKEY